MITMYTRHQCSEFYHAVIPLISQSTLASRKALLHLLMNKRKQRNVEAGNSPSKTPTDDNRLLNMYMEGRGGVK